MKRKISFFKKELIFIHLGIANTSEKVPLENTISHSVHLF